MKIGNKQYPSTADILHNARAMTRNERQLTSRLIVLRKALLDIYADKSRREDERLSYAELQKLVVDTLEMDTNLAYEDHRATLVIAR